MPLPSAWDTVPVFGAHVQINGEPAQGSITFTARQRLHSYADEIAILPGPITAFLGQDGRFEIALPTTDDPDITPSGWAWEVTEQFGPEDRPTYQRTYIMLAPAGDPIDLTNIEPAVPPEEAPVVPWTSVAGKTPNAEGNIVLSFGDLVGTVPTEAIPAIALTDVHTVDSEAAMLALDAQRGDMAIRLDESQSYVLAADDSTQAASWVRLATPPDVVSSVAGRTGHVMLTKADVGLDQVDNTSDLAKPVSAATQDALDAKVPTTRTVATGTGLTGGGDLAADRTLSVAFGTTAGTVAAGDDPRFAGGEAIQDQVDDHADTLAQHAAALGAPGYGTVRHSTTRPFGLDAQHAAFPGAARLPDGSLYLVWRQGSNHWTNRDGSLLASRSRDLGRTWTQPVTIVPYAGDGVDYRDPSVSVSRDGTRMYLTYFKGTSAVAAAGAFLRVSTDQGQTWGPEVRMDTLPYAAICAPLVELGTGDLLGFLYGHSGSETQDSVWLVRSSDQGQTWQAPVRLVNGVTDARNYQEPWAVQRGDQLVVLFRWGSGDGIGTIAATNAAATTWGTPGRRFGGSGRPSAVWLSTGTMVVTYRASTGGALVYRASRDGGVSWDAERLLSRPPTGGMMTYASPIETFTGEAFCPYTEEDSAGVVSRLYLSYLSEGGSYTPLGPTPDTRLAVPTRVDDVLYATEFNQPDGPPPPEWTVFSGSPAIRGGRLVSGTQDTTPERLVVDVGTADATVEAHLAFTGGSTTQIGYGLILRYVDPGNFLMVAAEVATGTGVDLHPTQLNVYRNYQGTLYRRYSSTWNTAFTEPTVTLGTAPNPALYSTSYNRLKAEMRGRVIIFYINDVMVHWMNNSTDATTPLGTATRHGIVLNAPVGQQQYCRRFTMIG